MGEKSLGTLLGEYNVLKAELKRRSMIYQYDEKCRAAKFFGLTFEQVDLPYAEWAVIRAQYHAAVD